MLRLSAEVSARAARFGARVKMGGGRQCSLSTAHVRVVHGKVLGRAAAAALLNMRWKGERGGGGGSVTKGRNGVVVVVGGGVA